MPTQRLVRLSIAMAVAGASWLVLLLAIAESRSTANSVLISICTLFAAAASLSVLGLLLERDDDTTFRLGGRSTLGAQVAVTRALADASGIATRADLFTLLAARDCPLSFKQLDRAVAELEHAGAIVSDFDEDSGTRVYRVLSTRQRVSKPESGGRS